MEHSYTKYVLLGVIGVFLILFVLFPTFTYKFIPYSIYNSDWNGCSEFYNFAGAHSKAYPIMSSYNTNRLKNGTVIIIAPQMPFTKYEIENIKKHLNNGNTLVIVDDEGTESNDLLGELNLSKRISKGRAYDLFYLKNYSFPIVRYNIEGHEGTVITSIPAYVVNPSNEIVMTSDITKKVIMEVVYFNNNTKVIIISDPDIFTNQFESHNMLFWKNLMLILDDNIYYFDETHHSKNGLYDLMFYILPANTSLVERTIIFMVISLIGLVFTLYNNAEVRKYIAKLKKEDDDDDIIIDDEIRFIIEKIKSGRNYGWKRTFR